MGPRYEHTALANELELAQSSQKTLTCNHLHGPAMRTHCPCRCARVGPKQPENIHLQPPAWAHGANTLPLPMSSSWPKAARKHSPATIRMGPRCEHTALADELELAQSSLKTFTRNHSHGPISCTIVLRQLPRIGLQCEHTALADELELAQSSLKTFTCNHSHGPAMQTHCPCRCARVGPKHPENIHPQPLVRAHDANTLPLPMSSSWPKAA